MKQSPSISVEVSHGQCSLVRMIVRGLLIVFVFVGASWSQGRVYAQEQEQDPKPPPASSLDEDLGDELVDDLLGELEGDLGGESGEPKDPVDRELIKDLEAGDDLGKAQEDPLSAIARRMRETEERIVDRDTSESTQSLQRDIIGNLDSLIEQLNKKCQCKGGGQGQSKKQQKTEQQAKQDSPQKDAKASKQAGESNSPNAQLAPAEATTSVPDEAERARRLWGHLPPRFREQIQNTSAEEFLPKYQRLIEEFYQRLADQSKD